MSRDLIRLRDDLDVPLAPAGVASGELPPPRDVVEALGLW